MDKPELYANTNCWQRRYTQEVIEELNELFNWKSNNGDTLLDIGTGPGDVMIDFILPLLPENYGKIVGSDSTEEMVKHGTETYGPRDPRIIFQILDISAQNLQISEQFDHVTSFWVFNWVHNQRLGMKNIFNLLKPEGDILMEFGAKSPFCLTFEKLSITSKWQKYLINIGRFIFPHQHTENPVEDFVNILKETGFQDIYCRTRDFSFMFNGYQEIKDFFKSINIIEGDIPAELHDEFYLEFFDEFFKQDIVSLEGADNEMIKFTITALIAYAKKKK